MSYNPVARSSSAKPKTEASTKLRIVQHNLLFNEVWFITPCTYDRRLYNYNWNWIIRVPTIWCAALKGTLGQFTSPRYSPPRRRQSHCCYGLQSAVDWVDCCWHSKHILPHLDLFDGHIKSCGSFVCVCKMRAYSYMKNCLLATCMCGNPFDIGSGCARLR